MWTDRRRPTNPLILACVLVAAANISRTRAENLGIRAGSPADELPEWIPPRKANALRPDWSPDGKRLVYLDALVGDVFEREPAEPAVAQWASA